MATLICGLITSLILLIYGIFLMFFKEVITNKDIIIYLFVGFAYVGYMFQIYTKSETKLGSNKKIKIDFDDLKCPEGFTEKVMKKTRKRGEVRKDD